MRVVAFIVLVFCCGGAHAEPLVAAMGDKDYPPFYYYDAAEGRWAGISVEVCEAVAAELGFTLTYRRYPFTRMLQHVSSGQADIACTLFNTSQRAPGVTYTAVPHTFEDIWVFSRKDTANWDALDLDTLRKSRLGGVRAYFYGHSLEDDTSFRKLLVNNEEQLIKVLLGGRIDYALGNKPAIELQARALGVADQLRFLEPPVYQGPIFIAISRNREDALELASDFTQAITRFRETPEYATLLQKYGLERPRF